MGVLPLGHSYGGTVTAKVAEQLTASIRRLVFWNAFVLNDGECLNDNVPPHYKAMFDSMAAASSDNTVMLPYPVWREAFINDADEALVQSSFAQLSPEPYQQFTDKLDLKKFLEPRPGQSNAMQLLKLHGRHRPA